MLPHAELQEWQELAGLSRRSGKEGNLFEPNRPWSRRNPRLVLGPSDAPAATGPRSLAL